MKDMGSIIIINVGDTAENVKIPIARLADRDGWANKPAADADNEVETAHGTAAAT